MDYNKAALEMHESHHGKVGIVSKVEVKTRDDLSTAYTPGVAEPCRKIKENPEDVYKYTFKSNMVAEHCLDNTSGEIEVPVKMLVTRARTERPHGALL